MTSRLRHIAIIVPDPEQAAKFFEHAFGMTRAGTARRGIYMSDGTMNVALLKTEGNEKPGLYHFGMWVDDLDEAEKKVDRCRRQISRRPADLAEFVLRGEISRPRTAWCSISPITAGPARIRKSVRRRRDCPWHMRPIASSSSAPGRSGSACRWRWRRPVRKSASSKRSATIISSNRCRAPAPIIRRRSKCSTASGSTTSSNRAASSRRCSITGTATKAS